MGNLKSVLDGTRLTGATRYRTARLGLLGLGSEVVVLQVEEVGWRTDSGCHRRATRWRDARPSEAEDVNMTAAT